MIPVTKFLRHARLLASAVLVGSLVAIASAQKPVSSPVPPGSKPIPARPGAPEPDAFIDVPGAAQFETQPAPLPPALPGVPFASTGTGEIGDLIRLDGSTHFVGSVSIAMTTSATRSEFPDHGPFGFTHPITLTLYAVDRTGLEAQPGVELASVTEAFLIPWRPEADPASTLPGRPWKTADGNHYTSRAFTLTFDLGALGLSLPHEIIYGISFNTRDHGRRPLGVAGPYDRLGVAVSLAPAGIGADVQPDAVFWKSADAAGYADGGLAGVNRFRLDSGWAPYQPVVRFTDSIYGDLFGTIAHLHSLAADDGATAKALRTAAELTGLALDRSLWDGNQRLHPIYGYEFFDNCSAAADALAYVAGGEDELGAEAQVVIESIVATAETLADTAIAMAMVFGGKSTEIIRAQNALEQAARDEAAGRYGKAILGYSAAWQTALQALR